MGNLNQISVQSMPDLNGDLLSLKDPALFTAGQGGIFVCRVRHGSLSDLLV